MLESGQDRKIAAIITSVCVCFFYEVIYNMEEYFAIALSEADKAFKLGEIPVGAVIVFNNKIISKAHNLKMKKYDITSHAEILAIKKAARKLKDWRLSECDLYVTLEPCDMCKEVIKQSRFRNIYYLVEKLDYKKTYDKSSFEKVENEVLFDSADVYRKKLSTFFKLKCKR